MLSSKKEIEGNLLLIFTIAWPNTQFLFHCSKFTPQAPPNSDAIDEFDVNKSSKTGANGNFKSGESSKFLEFNLEEYRKEEIQRNAQRELDAKRWILSQIDIYMFLGHKNGYEMILETLLKDRPCFDYIFNFLMDNFLESIINQNIFSIFLRITEHLLQDYKKILEKSCHLKHLESKIQQHFTSIALLQNGHTILSAFNISGIRFYIKTLSEQMLLTHSNRGRLAYKKFVTNNNFFTFSNEILQNLEISIEYPNSFAFLIDMLNSSLLFCIEVLHRIEEQIYLCECSGEENHFEGIFLKKMLKYVNENNDCVPEIVKFLTRRLKQFKNGKIRSELSQAMLRSFFFSDHPDEVNFFRSLFPQMTRYLNDLDSCMVIGMLLIEFKKQINNQNLSN